MIRTFVDPTNPEDVAAANALQDQSKIIQNDKGSFEIPDWDKEKPCRSQKRDQGAWQHAYRYHPVLRAKGAAEPALSPDRHCRWLGFNPPEAAVHNLGIVKNNDGTPYTVTVKDVPVDGFWSITVYNSEGYMEPNDLGVNSYNNVTAKPNVDGSYTVNFGGCDDGRINCIPIMDGWNYAIRQYQPREEILSGKWHFPEFEPAN